MAKKPKKIKRRDYKIKECKLVETSRLRVVKDVHLNGWINPEKYEFHKSELIEKISNNKGMYPKDEAILVWKSKDPKDKRKVIYNIEDGYRRSLMADDLKLDRVYINIIDEENNKS